MGLIKGVGQLEVTKSGNGVKFWDKETRRHFVAPKGAVQDFVAGKKASVEFSLIVSDPPAENEATQHE